MSLGNGMAQSGDQGSNFNFEFSVLQMLQQIVNNQSSGSGGGGGGGSTGTATPFGPVRATGSGSVPANTYSFSAYNAGNANATINGSTIKPGEVLSWTAPSGTKFTNSVSYNGSGTELVLAWVL